MSLYFNHHTIGLFINHQIIKFLSCCKKTLEHISIAIGLSLSNFTTFVIKLLSKCIWISVNAHLYPVQVACWLFVKNALIYQLSTSFIDRPIIAKTNEDQYFLLHYQESVLTRSLFLPLIVSNWKFINQ